MPKHLPRFSSGHTDPHCRVARCPVHNSRHRTFPASTRTTSADLRTSMPRASHSRVSALAPARVAFAPTDCRPASPTTQASPSHPRVSPWHASASTVGFPLVRASAPARIRMALRKNRLDPRPSAPPPARAAMPKHLPRFSSGHTDPHCRLARCHSAQLPARRPAPRVATFAPACVAPRTLERRPLAPSSVAPRTSKPRASHQRVSPSRMALRKTALIRVPQLRRRPGRLCQSTCHGFPPVIQTRTVAWRGVTAHNSRHRTFQRRPAPRVSTCAPARLAPRTRECRRSHQQASTLAPEGVAARTKGCRPLAPACVSPRTNECRPSHQHASPSHQQASTSHPRASPLAPRTTSYLVGLRPLNRVDDVDVLWLGAGLQFQPELLLNRGEQ